MRKCELHFPIMIWIFMLNVNVGSIENKYTWISSISMENEVCECDNNHGRPITISLYVGWTQGERRTFSCFFAYPGSF